MEFKLTVLILLRLTEYEFYTWIAMTLFTCFAINIRAIEYIKIYNDG